MNRLMTAVGLVCLCLLPGTCCAYMSIEPITGRYTPASTSTQFDEDLAALGNSKGRVYGQSMFFSEVGVTETLYFAGGAAEFGAFLKRYSALRYRPLVLRRIDGAARPTVVTRPASVDCEGQKLAEKREEYDWMLVHHLTGSLGGEESVQLEAWPEGVRLDAVNVPANVTVESENRRRAAGDLSNLDIIAREIAGASGGKSKLLMDGASTRPEASVAKTSSRGQIEFLRVYAVSSSVRKNLPGVGPGKIIGAITIGVGATSLDGRARLQPGTYMLFYRTTGIFLGDEAGLPDVSLVSVEPGRDGRVRYAEKLRRRLLGHDPEDPVVRSRVTINFPGPPEVSTNNPAGRARISLCLPGEIYLFTLDLDIPAV